MDDVHKETPVVELVPAAFADKVIVLATESKDEIVVPDVIVTVLAVPAAMATCCPTATFRNEDTLVILSLPAVMSPVKEASARVNRVTSANETPVIVEIADNTY